MKTETLSTVTLQTIENYRNAASLAVDAYRAGSHRLLDAVNDGLDKNVYSRTGKVAPQLTNTLTQVRSNLTDIIVKGIDGVSERTEQAIEVSSTTAVKRVTQVTEFAAGIENPIVVNGLEAAMRFSLPGAKAALAVSAKIAEGADALSRAAAGKPVKAVKAATKAVAKAKRSVARKASTTQAAVSRKAAAAKKATVSRAKRTVAKVEAAVA